MSCILFVSIIPPGSSGRYYRRTMPDASRISVVVPFFNEEGSVARLHAEIRAAVPGAELIYVNDGSSDGTLAALRACGGATVVDLNRNYGQGAALDAGIKAATGDILVTLDGDGQNDPADIPRLVAALRSAPDTDVIAGWRKDRRDKKGIVLLSRLGRLARRIFIGDVVHDAGCTLRAYRSAAAKSLELSGEMHRYIVALLRWNGFRVSETPVGHRPRATGASKYSYAKAARGSFDLLYVWFICKYSERPVHFFGYVSAASLAAGFCLAALSIYQKVAFGLSLNRNGWFFVALFLFICAMIAFGFGILFDLMAHGHPNAPRAGTGQGVSGRYRIRNIYRPR